jgi:3-isopropylmalate/(R)-2-methylmalate dehydratase small subunit
MASRFSGRAHVYGDDIDTDRIIPGKYTKTLDLQSLADHVLEDLDPEFRSRLTKGDVLVAGSNFGCGSSREQAPLALKVAGVSAVIAKYFARIFFRNAINIGLPVLEVADLEAEAGDELEIDLAQGVVRNLTRETTHHASPMPDVMIDILNEGGLVAYLKKNGTYDQSSL